VDLHFGPDTYIGPGFSLDAPHGGKFSVGRGVSFRRNFRAELADESSRITIGDGCVFSADVLIQCVSAIDIGDRAHFGQSTLVVDANHRFRDIDKPVFDQGMETVPVRVADDACVMSKCTIVASLGVHSFVGANAVVTRPVPDHCLAAGVPARVIEDFGPARSGVSEASRDDRPDYGS
jgi:acetyltransferase-like isoleucine patch superfamily enzyme